MGKASLKSILKEFLNRFAHLESQLTGSPTKEDGYFKEFQTLKELSETLKKDKSKVCEGEREINIRKNRYKDILPFDGTRVILNEFPGIPGSDYINANYIRGPSGFAKAYIACQGPLQGTLSDFWRMIWECDVSVIIMACNEHESGKLKCECYWPEQSDTSQQYGIIEVTLVKIRQICPDFLVRKFCLRTVEDRQERIVCQFHYTTWPDHGVPDSVQPILELVRLVRDVQSSEDRPILVHCSAGCGRTGTICGIDFVFGLLRRGKLDQSFSLHQVITDMRLQRVAMVQTLDQYILCHRAVAALFKQQLRIIDDHIYENLNEEGKCVLLLDNFRFYLFLMNAN